MDFLSLFVDLNMFTWVLHELEAFICKALQAEAIVIYGSALITPQMEASGSPIG